MEKMIFTTIAKAKKQTGLSYLGGVSLSAKLAKNEKEEYKFDLRSILEFRKK